MAPRWARADALHDRLEALQLNQLEAEGAASDVQAAELTAQPKQARADAEALRQAEAERRARGAGRGSRRRGGRSEGPPGRT